MRHASYSKRYGQAMNKLRYIILLLFNVVILDAQHFIYDQEIITQNLMELLHLEGSIVTQDYIKYDTCIHMDHIWYSHSKYSTTESGYRLNFIKLNSNDCKLNRNHLSVRRSLRDKYADFSKEFELMKEYNNDKILYDPNILFKVKLIESYNFHPFDNVYKIYPGDLSRGIILKERVANAFDIFKSPTMELKFYKNDQIIKTHVFERKIQRHIFDEMAEEKIDLIKLTVANKYKDKLIMKFELVNEASP